MGPVMVLTPDKGTKFSAALYITVLKVPLVDHQPRPRRARTAAHPPADRDINEPDLSVRPLST